MKVELIDLKARYADEHKDLNSIINKVLKAGNLVLTKEVENFENNISNFLSTRYTLGLNSGTDALMLALWASGIKKGDEVITTPKSFVATIGAIIHIGAKPIFVDIDDSLNLDINAIESKITKKTKAIVAVHWAGRMCNMIELNRISKKYKLTLIEDAAQAIGSSFNKIKPGELSDIATFSAHPLKILNAIGDAGYLTTNSKKIFDKVKLYRNHGLYKRDDVRIFGVNSRLDSLNAEILSFRLKKINKIIQRRENNINLYRNFLKNCEEIQLPFFESYEKSSHTLFISRAKKRNELQNFLLKNNIQSAVYYGQPLHKHKASKNLGYNKLKLPNVEKICKEIISFPHHQYLTQKQIKFVCNKILKFYAKK